MNKRTIRFPEITMENWRAFLEDLYLVILAVFLVKSCLANTMFPDIWPKNTEWVIRILAAGVGAGRIFLFQERKKEDVLLAFLISIGYSLSFTYTHYEFLLDIPIMMIGAWGIYYKKILKVYIWCSSGVLATAVLGSFYGVIKDLVYLRTSGEETAIDDFLLKIFRCFHFSIPEGGIYARHAFGTVFPTDFAAWLFFLAVAMWMYAEWVNSAFWIFPFIGLSYFVYRYAIARNSSLMFMFAAIVAGVVAVMEQCRERIIFNKINNVFCKMCSVLCLPVFFGILIRLMSADTQNKLLTDTSSLANRLRYAQDAYNKYGIKLWGTSFDLLGYGRIDAGQLKYNFIDISYCLIPLRYGVAVTIAVSLIFAVVGIKGSDLKQYRIVAVVCLIGIHGLVEHHMMESAYASILLLPLASYTGKENRKEKKRISGKKLRIGLRIVVFGLILCGVIGKIIENFDLWRTRAVLMDEENVLTQYLLVCLGIILCLYLSAFFIFNKKKYTMCIPIFLLMLIIMHPYFKKEMYIDEPKIKELKKSGVVTKLIENQGKGGYRFCSNGNLVVHKRELQGIQTSFYYGNANAGQSDMVILTDIKEDLYMLTNFGFNFVALSSDYGIYTNSDAAKDILRSYGYELQRVYNVPQILKIKDRETNVWGPIDIVTGGSSRVHCFRMTIHCEISGNLEDDYLGTVSILHAGQNITVKKETITLDKLDAENNICLEFEMELVDDQKHYIVVEPVNNQIKLSTDCIRYWKTW